MNRFLSFKAMVLSFVLASIMLVPSTMNAQRNDGFFRNYDNGDRTADYTPTWNVENNGIGQSEVPLGSGLLILGVAGAGYAIAKRRKKQNNSLTLLLAAVMLLGLTQCKKNNVDPTGGTKYYISIPVDDGSKVNVNPTGGDGYATVSFEDGDIIYVGYNNAYVGTITYNATNSRFEGSITTDIDGTQPLHLYMLGGKGFTPTIVDNTATVNISDQTNRYPVISYSPTTTDFTGSGTYSAKLLNKCSIMKFNLTTSSTAAICITDMNNKVTVNFADPTDPENGFSFSKDGNGLIKMPKVNESVTWAIVLPQVALDASTADYSIYTNDYQGRRPEIHAIERNHYYNGGISLTFNSTPTGMLLGEFTIGSGQTIHFSKGNLQYRASDTTWMFADNQYDYKGDENKYISSTYDGWIDLFGWGTSGYEHSTTYWQPWSASTDETKYKPYGSQTTNLYDGSGQADWGYNKISNGGNQENQWRTLTNDEWVYVLETRSASKVNGKENARFVKATVNNVKGLILFPDSYTHPDYVNLPGYGYVNSNVGEYIYTPDNWSKMEAVGCVFLPAAGRRLETSVYDVGSGGRYWSSAYKPDLSAYCVRFVSDYVATMHDSFRYRGLSVRLVR